MLTTVVKPPDGRLLLFAGELLGLAAEALCERRPTRKFLPGNVAVAAVPTPANATRDERHRVASEGARRLIPMSGNRSVSHAADVSIVLTGVVTPDRFGIDLERTAPVRPRLVTRIRSASESVSLPLDAPWEEVLRCFCVKEAAFKALPHGEQTGLTFRRLAVASKASGPHVFVQRVGDGHVVAEACVVADANVVVAVAKAILG